MGNEYLNILLADDDADDRLFFKEAMEEINLQTIISFVNDGNQLMHYLDQNEISLPDLIFLDINMPGKNGLECLRELRNMDKFNEIVVVIYSTSGAENDIQTALKYGANQYLKKPDNFNILKECLANVIKGFVYTPQFSC